MSELFLGIDLAWKPVNRTGLALVDVDGRLVDSGTAVTDDDIAAWVDRHGGSVVVAAVDAPLVVPNETGQRAGENEIARAYGRYGAAPHSSSRANPMFRPPRAETLARRRGWEVDPALRGSVEVPMCIEVYPHPAMVGLFELPQRIHYKKGPDRAAGFAELVRHLETLDVLALSQSARWGELRRVVAAPGPGDLTRVEDELDAVLCAHLAWLWHHRPDALQVYGSLADGYVVAPPPPRHVPAPRVAVAAPETAGPAAPRPLAARAAARHRG